MWTWAVAIPLAYVYMKWHALMNEVGGGGEGAVSERLTLSPDKDN